MAIIVGIAGAVGCTGGSTATTYCVSENGALSAGACVTECKSRCTLAARAGCEPADCSKCDTTPPTESTACRNADYAHWRCLRLANEPQVTCVDGKPVFQITNSVCTEEARTMTAACGDRDGGPALRDAALDAH